MRDGDRRARVAATRCAGANGARCERRRDPRRGGCGRAGDLAGRPRGRRALPLYRGDGRRSGKRRREGFRRAGAGQAGDAGRHRDLPGRGVPATSAELSGGGREANARALHGTAPDAATDDGRGGGGRLPPPNPAHGARRRASPDGRADGADGRLVAPLELRWGPGCRLERVRSGSPRRLARRCQHAREDRRQRPGRARAARAALPDARRDDSTGTDAVRAAAG